MSELSDKNFGLLVAYVLPGFVSLWAVGRFSETVKSWIVTSQHGAPTVAGFLYVTLASLTMGLTVSAIRWAVIDTLHHATGIKPPKWEFASLDQRLQGFHGLVENHYRYYQFYSNMSISALLAYLAHALSESTSLCQPSLQELGFILLEFILLAGSRDSLRKYYDRAERLLGTTNPAKGDSLMTNGYDHEKHETSKKATKKKPTSEKKTVIEAQPTGRRAR